MTLAPRCPTEEARRIDLIDFLLERKYPRDNIAVETVILKKLGERGRNTLRCDLIVYREPATELAHLPLTEKIAKAILVAEVKRDSSRKISGVTCQLEPAMRQLPGMHGMGIYWDDVNRILFIKQLIRRNGDEHLELILDTLANLPAFRNVYRVKALTYKDLDKSANLVGILFNIANVMRSHGINDEHLRYKETVKLLLARYCDEKEGMESPEEPLSLQVYPGADPQFMRRVKTCDKTAANRYS